MNPLFDVGFAVWLVVLTLLPGIPISCANGQPAQDQALLPLSQNSSENTRVETVTEGDVDELLRRKRDAKIQPLLRPLLLRMSEEQTSRRLSGNKDGDNLSNSTPKVPAEKIVRIKLTVKDDDLESRSGSMEIPISMTNESGTNKKMTAESTGPVEGNEKTVDLKQGSPESGPTAEGTLNALSLNAEDKMLSTISSLTDVGEEITTVESVTIPEIPAAESGSKSTTELDRSTTMKQTLEIETKTERIQTITDVTDAPNAGRNKNTLGSNQTNEFTPQTQHAGSIGLVLNDTSPVIENNVNTSEKIVPVAGVTEPSNFLLSTLMDYDGNTGLRTLLKQKYKLQRNSGLSRDSDVKSQISSLHPFDKYVTPAQKHENLMNVTTISTVEIEDKKDVGNITSDIGTSNIVPDLLRDIKLILQESNSSENQKEFENLELRYDMLQHMTTSKIEAIEESLETFVVHTDQKLDLVIENLSTLKILAIGQNEQVLSNVQKLEEFKHRLDQLQERQTKATNLASAPANLIENALIEPKEEATLATANDTCDPFSIAFHNLTTQVESNDETSRKKILELSVRIVQLEESLSAYEGKIDRHFMRQNTASSTPAADTNKSVCACNVSSLQNEIIDLKDTVTSQSLLIDILQSSSASLQNEVDEIRLVNNDYKLSMSKDSKDDATKLPSELDGSLSMLSDSIQAKVVASVMEMVNARMANFEEELEAVRDLRDEVALLRRELHNTELRNETALTGLCVWPYKPGASGCYHVHTEERLGWTAARSKCQDLQGDLASPPDFEAFKKFLMGQRLSRSYSFWVGSNNHELGSQWLWLDGRGVGKEVWATGQPNQLRADTCMEVRPDLRFFGADEACRVPNYFICQQRGT